MCKTVAAITAVAMLKTTRAALATGTRNVDDCDGDKVRTR